MSEIIGDILLLRPITDQDTEPVLKWRNSKAVKSNFIYQPDVTREDHENWLRTKVATGEVIQFIIIERETNRGIGSVYLNHVDYSERTAEYGIFIGEESVKGKGYGSKTCQMVVRYAFEELHFRKLTLRVLKRNEVAIRSYECAGFHRDHSHTEHVIINGVEEEVQYYIIEAEE